MEHVELEKTGWVQRMKGTIVQPSSEFPKSCSSGKGRTIDYFVVSEGLACKVADCFVVQEALTTPHKPVRIEFFSDAALPEMRVQRHPKRFPRTPVVGPRRPQGHWDEVKTMAMDRTSTAKNRVVPLFRAWVKAFEETMCGLHDLVGEAAEPYVGRAEGPTYVWRKPQSARGCVHPKTSPAAKSWRWMADRVAELVSLQGKESQGACLHRKQLVVLLRKWKPQEEQRMTCADEDEDGCSTARGKLREDVDAAFAAYRRWTRKVTPQCVDRSGWWIAEGHRLADRLDRVHWRQAGTAWRAWAADACEASAEESCFLCSDLLPL